MVPNTASGKILKNYVFSRRKPSWAKAEERNAIAIKGQDFVVGNNKNIIICFSVVEKLLLFDMKKSNCGNNFLFDIKESNQREYESIRSRN